MQPAFKGGVKVLSGGQSPTTNSRSIARIPVGSTSMALKKFKISG